jgi:hypothetical protein
MPLTLQKLGLRTRLIAAVLASIVLIAFLIFVAAMLATSGSTALTIMTMTFIPLLGIFLVMSVGYSCWLGFYMRWKNEARKDRGEPVYVNRYSHNGSFKHYTLVVRNVKYELRLDPEDKTKSIFAFKDGFHFSANTAAEETGQTGETGIETHLPFIPSHNSSYKFGGFLYHNLLFGWTSKSHEEIVADAEKVLEKYANYNWMLRNCQGFVKDLAMRITADDEHRTGETFFLVARDQTHRAATIPRRTATFPRRAATFPRTNIGSTSSDVVELEALVSQQDSEHQGNAAQHDEALDDVDQDDRNVVIWELENRMNPVVYVA